MQSLISLCGASGAVVRQGCGAVNESRWPLPLERVRPQSPERTASISISPGWWKHRANLQASLSPKKMGLWHFLITNMLPCAWLVFSPHNTEGKQAFKSFKLVFIASLPQQEIWWKTRSRADSNIVARRQKKMGHMVVSARWQQWHVCATCPGEYEPLSLLLFSQCGVTLALCLPCWLIGCQPVHLAIWPSVGLASSQSLYIFASLTVSPFVHWTSFAVPPVFLIPF